MSDSSLLETTAEIAVAFAGFASIFLVLASRDGRFPPHDAFSIKLIVVVSVASVINAVIPLLLHSLGVPEPAVWRASSGLNGLHRRDNRRVHAAHVARDTTGGQAREHGLSLSVRWRFGGDHLVLFDRERLGMAVDAIWRRLLIGSMVEPRDRRGIVCPSSFSKGCCKIEGGVRVLRDAWNLTIHP